MFTRPTLTVFSRRNMQIFDLMELAGKEWDMKASCRKNIRAVGEWKNNDANAQRLSSAIYISLEKYLLLRRARKSVQFYRTARRKRVRLFHDYMQGLPVRNAYVSAVA